MLRRTICQADVVVEFEPVDPILIKSGYATMDGPDMVPVVTFRDGAQTYYFPGSSLKGVLRSQFERIARTLVPGSVCIPYFDPRRDIPVPVVSEQQAHGCGFRASTDNDASSVAYGDSCAACRMFGSLKFGGRFSIGDAYPIENHQPVPEQRNGVGIDRFTGGTVRGVLFDLQALVGGRFRANIRLVNFEVWQLAALNILLFDLADELIAIGSGRSRGLGRVRGKVAEYKLSYIQATASAGASCGGCRRSKNCRRTIRSQFSSSSTHSSPSIKARRADNPAEEQAKRRTGEHARQSASPANHEWRGYLFSPCDKRIPA